MRAARANDYETSKTRMVVSFVFRGCTFFLMLLTELFFLRGGYVRLHTWRFMTEFPFKVL